MTLSSDTPASKQKLLQQHWVHGPAVKPFVTQLDWKGLRVLELGAGTGALTRLIAECGARQIDALELDSELPPVVADNVVWRNADILQLRPADVAPFDALAAFAPYNLLETVFDLAQPVCKVFLMIPQRHLALAERKGYSQLGVLSGSAFEPPASGQHYLIAKGF